MGIGSVGAAEASPRVGSPKPVTFVRDWLRVHDPGYLALRRAARAALIMPVMFALGDKVIGNPALALFAAFGSFAMLLLVDFSGSINERLLAQTSLGIACAVLVCLGTLASRTTWLAVLGMSVVAFVILFAGVVSSVLASATTALLLAFILPVSLPGPVSSIPDRVAGWSLAAAVSVLAISLLWPAPARNPIRGAVITASRALAARLRAEVEFVLGGGEPAITDAHREAVEAAAQAVDSLYAAFFATPSRPNGLNTSARAVVRLVDELRWLNGIVLRSAPPGHQPPAPNSHVCSVKLTAGDVLERVAEVLEGSEGAIEQLEASLAAMQEAVRSLESAATDRLPREVLASAQRDGMAAHVVSSLDPSFRAQELSFVVGQIATNTMYAEAADRRSWRDKLLGHQPSGLIGPLSAAQRRAVSHWELQSVWLRNSIRGAVALGLAVLVADLSAVQHAFWVSFGTLAVLRSSALSTGQNLLRALVGTTVGFVIGGGLVYVIGTNTAVLWVLLPIVDAVRRAGAGGGVLRCRPGGVHHDAADPLQSAGPGRLADRLPPRSRTSPSAGR